MTGRELGRVSACAPVRNCLLAALPAPALAGLAPHLETVALTTGDVLFHAAAPIRRIYFPETAVVSMVSDLPDGDTVEVGTVGCEGVAGLAAFLGDDVSPVRAFVQIPGTARCLPADVFTALAGAPGPLHRAMLRYTQAYLTQVAQTAACNAGHLVDARCARWLLMTHDRAAGDAFPLRHEFLAFMLGVRREGVLGPLKALEDAGCIADDPGAIRVVDRARLERASCACYGVVRAHYDRLLGAGSA